MMVNIKKYLLLIMLPISCLACDRLHMQYFRNSSEKQIKVEIRNRDQKSILDEQYLDPGDEFYFDIIGYGKECIYKEELAKIIDISIYDSDGNLVIDKDNFLLNDSIFLVEKKDSQNGKCTYSIKLQ